MRDNNFGISFISVLLRCVRLENFCYVFYVGVSGLVRVCFGSSGRIFSGRSRGKALR